MVIVKTVGFALLTATTTPKNRTSLCHFTDSINQSNNIAAKQIRLPLTTKLLRCEPYY